MCFVTQTTLKDPLCIPVVFYLCGSIHYKNITPTPVRGAPFDFQGDMEVGVGSNFFFRRRSFFL